MCPRDWKGFPRSFTNVVVATDFNSIDVVLGEAVFRLHSPSSFQRRTKISIWNVSCALANQEVFEV